MTSPFIVPGPIASDLSAGTSREWLESNGLGSFAMGTVAGPATRRYHSLLCVATRPPVARMVLVNRCEESLLVQGAHYQLGSNFYPDVCHPEGYRAITEFRLDPWPTWRIEIGGATLVRSLFMPQGRQMTVVEWRLIDGPHARLFIRPLLSGRDSHALHHENPVLRQNVEIDEGLVIASPYDGVPSTFLHHNGVYTHRPDWYRNLQYPVERERGLDFEEDLFSPGELAFDLGPGARAICVFSAEEKDELDVTQLRTAENARRACLTSSDDFTGRLTLAADHFVVQRNTHRTIIAGYPWFTDWGRDTFISLPGLSSTTGGKDLARELLLAFAPHISDGMVPNRFPEKEEKPEYNSVDASLWYVLAACRYARVSGIGEDLERVILPAVQKIIDGYLAGTHLGIGLDDDGLLQASSPGLQLTWMDAKVGDWVVTPRQGKPVEIQALWVATLEAVSRLMTERDPTFSRELADRAAWARSSFVATFWSDSLGYLFDVVDGLRRDTALRPNQLYAIGLCAPLIERERAERVLSICERELLTPVGLRSRSRDASYHGQMTGGPRDRDAAYHQGTVWPYLLGIYADACMRVRGKVPAKILDGVRAYSSGVGMGTIGEVFDGDYPHRPRGCVAQAWSVAEVLRILRGEIGQDA